jgi:hypothetical protein
LQGAQPYVRVGGNTQDFNTYNPNLTVAYNAIYNTSVTVDQPQVVEIGDKFFESFETWPNTKFSFGFKLGTVNETENLESVIGLAEIVCKFLGNEKLFSLEYGNEPDRGVIVGARPQGYGDEEYVREWLFGTRRIDHAMRQACPTFDPTKVGYLGLSISTLDRALNPNKTWNLGYNSDNNVNSFALHT